MQSRFAYIKVFVDAAGHVYVIWRLREHRVVEGKPLAGILADADDDLVRHLVRIVLRVENDDPIIPQVIRDPQEPGPAGRVPRPRPLRPVPPAVPRSGPAPSLAPQDGRRFPPGREDQPDPFMPQMPSEGADDGEA